MYTQPNMKYRQVTFTLKQ